MGVAVVGGGKGLRAELDWVGPGAGPVLSSCGTPPPQVHLQTQQEVKLRMTGMALQVVRSDGILALYNGLSASLCRQVPRGPPPGQGVGWVGLLGGHVCLPGSPLRAC